MAEIICPNCSAPNRATARFCNECGASLAAGRPADPSTPLSDERSTAPADAREPAAPVSGPPASERAGVEAPEVQSSESGPPASDRFDWTMPGSTPLAGDAAVSQPSEAPPSSAPPSGEPDDGAKSDDVPKASTGKVLYSRYNLSEELGRGGFGAVYKAWDANLNRLCAVKENLDATPEASRQFAREASVLANLSHPNLPRVTDHFSIPGQGQYLVMDFVEGQDLDSLARGDQRLPVDQALDWMIQVSNALVYLHSRTPAVVHRDIKPSNIRVTPEGRAMLVDFGLVKMLDPLLRTTMGARAVTPGYAPPEQYGMGRTDVRTDVYAMGATLYKILTGREPLESVLRVAGQPMPPAGQLNPEVSPQLNAVIEKALALDPANRFQTAADLKAALQAVRLPAGGPALVTRGVPVSQAAPVISGGLPAQPSGRPPSGPPRSPTGLPADRPASRPRSAAPASPARRSPWLWIVGGGAALLLIVCLAAGGGIWALLGLGEDPTPTSVALVEPTTLVAPGEPTDTPPSTDPAGETATPQADPISDVTPSATALPPTTTPDPAFLSADRTTFVHADDSEPDTLDPALSYTTGGLEVLMNIYETLVFYNREDPDSFVPQLAVEVPSQDNGGISADGRVYTFKIRSGVQFHDGSPLTPEDVAYTFQRNLLQGGSGSPMLLLAEPFLGVGVYDVASLVGSDMVDNPQGLIAADAARREAVCRQVVDAIQFDNAAGTVTFRLAQPWAPLLPTLAGAWGGIRSKAWTVANGGWDGECATWQNYYAPTLDEQNKTKLGTEAMGTGPFKFESWKAGDEIVLVANENYWRSQPAWPGGPTGAPALKRVVFRYRFTFGERLALVQSGEADALTYSSNADWPALESLTGRVCKGDDAHCEPGTNPNSPLESIRGFSEASRNWDVFFNQDIVTAGNTLVGSGKLDGQGIPADFFANVHVRKAFAYCFNYNSYLVDVLQGEGVRSINVMLPGMIGYDSSSPYYTYDPARCQEEFTQAVFADKNVWDTGFTLSLPVSPDQLPRTKIAEIFQRELTAVNPKFKVELKEMTQDAYNTLLAENKEPYYHHAWLEDMHDPHNWVVPYTVANQAVFAHLPSGQLNQFKDVINRGVIETDPEKRATIYKQFNQLFYDNAPAILLYQTGGRQYQQRWVRGWYNNPVLPGLYFYVLSKD